MKALDVLVLSAAVYLLGYLSHAVLPVPRLIELVREAL